MDVARSAQSVSCLRLADDDPEGVPTVPSETVRFLTVWSPYSHLELVVN